MAGGALRLFAFAAVLATPVVWAPARFAEAQLYGVKPHDPLGLTAAALMLGGVAWLAGYGPARRGARTAQM